MRRGMGMVVAALVLAACGGPAADARAVDEIRNNTRVEWPYTDDQTVDQMNGVCRSLRTRSVADLLDAFAGQWSGQFVTSDLAHDYGVLIRYSVEGRCPQFASVIEDQDYRGHPGWKGVYYGDKRG